MLKSSYPFKLEVICKPFTVGSDVNENSYNVKVIVDFEKAYPSKAKPKVIFEPISDIT